MEPSGGAEGFSKPGRRILIFPSSVGNWQFIQKILCVHCNTYSKCCPEESDWEVETLAEEFNVESDVYLNK